MFLRIGVASLLAVSMAAPDVPAVNVDPAVRTVMSRDLRFTSADFSELAHGKVVKRSIDTKNANEIAVIGGVWIDATTDAFLDEFRDIARFKKSEGVIQIGRFSDPPTLEDMAGLTVTDDDLDAQSCRVGDCSVRLPARELVRFRREIDWKAPGAKARAA